MIAVDGEDCLFLAFVMESSAPEKADYILPQTKETQDTNLICNEFVYADEDEKGTPVELHFRNADRFNFAFDIVDQIARQQGDRLAMLHVDNQKQERRFTFRDIKDASNQTANYFTSLGIRRVTV